MNTICSRDRLIFITGIPALVRWQLYITTPLFSWLEKLMNQFIIRIGTYDMILRGSNTCSLVGRYTVGCRYNAVPYIMILYTVLQWQEHNPQGWSNVHFINWFPMILYKKEIVLNSRIVHYLIMITCISYEIMFTLSLPKLINIASVLTSVIRVTDSIRHCNTDYSGLEWSNINMFWY